MFFMKNKEKALIEINGIFEGTINFNGKVVIADTGYCKIDIICKELDILGKLEGKVDVGILTIYDTGVYSGSAKYREINLMKDARVKFEGRVNDKENVPLKFESRTNDIESVPFKEEESVPVPNNKIEKMAISFKSSF